MQVVMLSKARGAPATPNLTVILSEAKDLCK
jgi:hypothetical protein